MNSIKTTYKYKTLLETMSRLENFQYTGLGIDWCCDYIYWLNKYKKISVDEIGMLADRATNILKNQVV